MTLTATQAAGIPTIEEMRRTFNLVIDTEYAFAKVTTHKPRRRSSVSKDGVLRIRLNDYVDDVASQRVVKALSKSGYSVRHDAPMAANQSQSDTFYISVPKPALEDKLRVAVQAASEVKPAITRRAISLKRQLENTYQEFMAALEKVHPELFKAISAMGAPKYQSARDRLQREFPALRSSRRYGYLRITKTAVTIDLHYASIEDVELYADIYSEGKDPAEVAKLVVAEIVSFRKENEHALERLKQDIDALQLLLDPNTFSAPAQQLSPL